MCATAKRSAQANAAYPARVARDDGLLLAARAVPTAPSAMASAPSSIDLVHRGGSCPPVILGPSADETTIYRRQGGVIMPGPRPQPIILTEAQRKMLMHLARRRNSTQGLVRRARIVLAAAEGYNNEQIANRLGINRETARLWRGVWLENEERLGVAEEAGARELHRCIEEEVLADRPRSGAPPTFTPEQVCQIVALACEAPSEESGRPVTHWSLRELADEAIKRGIVEDISPRSVGSFLKGGGPKAPPHALLDDQRARQRTGD